MPRFIPLFLSATLAGALLSAQSGLPAPATITPPVPHQVRTVVLDPGHGGDDAGVRADSGEIEKQLTLTLARRVKATIEARAGVRVVLTRDDDRDVPPDTRAATANAAKGDVFISLHYNGAWHASSAGAEVYGQASGPGHTDTAASETPPAMLPVPGGAPRVLDLISWGDVQARHAEASAAFADRLVEALSSRVPMSPRPRRLVPSRVLANVDMPAALVEAAYLTNADDASRGATEGFQTQVAEALADAVVRFVAPEAHP